MKRIMLVGKISSGKTTLSQRLTSKSLEYRKTQAIEVVDNWIIDTPGEYLEQRNFYRALMVTSVEADLIVLVHDATDTNSMFAPQIASMFPCPSVGVVTKSDLAQDGDVERAVLFLKDAGAERVFVTSSVADDGCNILYDYLSGAH